MGGMDGRRKTCTYIFTSVAFTETCSQLETVQYWGGVSRERHHSMMDGWSKSIDISTRREVLKGAGFGEA
jgi:hypothetical protein